MELTEKILKQRLHYEDGVLRWVKNGPKMKKGNIAGYHRKDGYCVIKLFGKPYLRHRLVWLYHYGKWPKGNLDHINRIPGDDKISNLRISTVRQNSYNTKSKANTSSKYKVVHWHKLSNKWMARARINGKRKYLGSFETEEGAAKAYDLATKDVHREFMNSNIKEKWT